MVYQSVKDYFKGQNILITGATGFIGKVLIEKLLRSCSGLDKIYVLVRMKKGKTPQERIADITNYPLFDTLKKQDATIIQRKIVPILGDVTELGLGLADEDRKMLIENVSIIFNGAASVRFDDPLKGAILMNTRATREIIYLALEMKKLEVFLHISTTYCNIDRKEVKEELYPAHGDWKEAIAIAENVDEHILQVLTTKYIGVLPNTYTFTKSLSEHCVYDLCKNKIPSIICRPSIVISSRSDPVPGWIDNFNGPVGLLVASGKGILRTCYTDPDLRADYVPVDVAVRAMILAAWNKGLTKDPEKKLDVSFYNCSNNGMYTVTMKGLIDFGKQICWESPLSRILWFPGGDVTGSKYWNYIKVIFLHLLPAVFIDTILKILKKKPMLVKIHRRIYIANMALAHFITNHWIFSNTNCLKLESYLSPDEVDEFGYDKDNINVYEYFKNCIVHGRKYLLKEDDSNLEQAKVNMYRMYLLDLFVRIFIYGFLFWFFVIKLKAPFYIRDKSQSIYNSLWE